jgi:ankyrin repeat protein
MDARLPLNPNLGFYRKTAKELKRAIAAGDAAALARLIASHPRYQGQQAKSVEAGKVSLKDTQLVIARGHGLATWAEFKAAVEKAAATPQPTPAERLLAAIQAGDGDAARALVASDPALVSRPTPDGSIPFIEACDRGRVDMVRILLDAGADARDPRALAAAAHPGPHKKKAAMEVVDLLIARGAANDVYTQAMLGRADELRRALPGVDVNAPGPSGATALALAAGNGHAEAARVLLEAGATPTKKIWDHVLLHLWGASYREIARLMVDHGAACSFEEACEIGHAGAARRLLTADPTLKDRPAGDGVLPLDRAILRGNAEIAAVLVEAGAADPHGQGRALAETEPQRGRNVARAVFRNCTLDNANFQSCSFENVVFHDVDLSGVQISYANLAGVRIGECSIKGLVIWGIEVEPLLAKEQQRRRAAKK